jgi:hypothetical protein
MQSNCLTATGEPMMLRMNINNMQQPSALGKLAWKLAAPSSWLSGRTGTTNKCLEIAELGFQRLATMTLGRLSFFNF